MIYKLVIIFFFIKIAFCDIAPLGTVGGLIFPIQSKQLSMVDETVFVKIFDDSISVDATFTILNKGNDCNTSIGFPDYAYRDDMSPSASIKNFSAWTNDSIVPVNRVHVKITKINDKNDEIISQADLIYTENSSGYSDIKADSIGQKNFGGKWKSDTTIYYWYQWALNIKKNSTKKIRVHFTGDWCHYYSEVLYLIGTGKYWADPIGKGRIVFDHSKYRSALFYDPNKMPNDTTGYAHFSLNKQITQKLFEDSVVYTFKDYRPTENELLGVAFSFIEFTNPTYAPYLWNKDSVEVWLKRELAERIEYDSSRLIRVSHFDKLPFTKYVGSPTFPLVSTFNKFNIKSLSKKVFFLRYCEQIARLGYIFNEPEINAYFRSKKWYIPKNSIAWNKCNIWTVYYVRQVAPIFKNIVSIAIPDSIRFKREKERIKNSK